MASTSERRKTVDRISTLPNCLICQILSFLSTKDAVRTSILSTHWNQQWTSITHLDFDDVHGSYRYPRVRKRRNAPTSRSSFVNFVHRVLLFKMTHLDSFRIKCHRDCGGVSHANSWISAALSRHVRHIDLSVPNNVNSPPPPLEPDGLFSSTSLVVLKLGYGFLIRVPSEITLQNLKTLHFNSVQFENTESLSRLVSRCPVLEELKMQGPLSKTMDVLSISSLVLKRLILARLYAKTHPYQVVLNTPSLEYLEHVDNGVPDSYHFEMETLHSLDRAYLCLILSNNQYEQYNDKLVLAKSMADLAVAISTVQFLYLSALAFKALYHPKCVLPNFELPKFPRLTELKIGYIALKEGLSLLIAFLQGSPQLASLSFALGEALENVGWDPPSVVPLCMQHNLKVIKVNFCSGRPLELEVVEYFLSKTVTLQELRVSNVMEASSSKSYRFPKGKVKSVAEIIDEVLMLPKASKSCTIVIT